MGHLDLFKGLGAWRDVDFLFTAQSFNRQRPSQQSLQIGNLNLAVKSGAVALEFFMGLHADLNEEVSGGTAAVTALTLTAEAQLCARVHAGGNVDQKFSLFFHPAFSVAGRARVFDHLALAVTGGTRTGHGEKSLLPDHLSAAPAGAASLHARAGLGSAAVAGGAVVLAAKLDGLFIALHHVFQFDFQNVAQIRSPARPRGRRALTAPAASSAHAAEKITEDVAELFKDVRDVVKALAASAPEAALEGRVAEAVVLSALVRVAEDFIGLGRFFEFFFGLFVPRVLVRMVLHGELAVGLFDSDLIRGAFDFEDFVIVPGHAFEYGVKGLTVKARTRESL